MSGKIAEIKQGPKELNCYFGSPVVLLYTIQIMHTVVHFGKVSPKNALSFVL